ncbi:hypothetical protein AOQ84DRAFT_330949 [Glonium stellatum]|uniref:Uncharacterized protein n=1 Tax=Glonium stellatum TaxID=574774 RepID=A0A8E2FCJ2_9PEZI|nr:hypothetical protein AOQ84DRAFT_330949 [Glonium stellatum]
MATDSLKDTSLDQLHSKEQAQLLNAIDELRAQGVSRHIGLPQLIVCGDQSSGKSSVLEGLTRLRFPTKDILCTTFATELALRRTPYKRISSTIKPGSSRSPAEKQHLSEFQESFTSADEFPSLIEEARKRMQAGSRLSNANAFSDDVLQIEISGPDRSPLTIVDLPGLIHFQNEKQSLKDVETVKELVTSYMKNPRSIILAVISAKNDRANQIVLKYAREIDPQGDRTLGIITKPDTLDAGGEGEQSYVDLAKNKLVNLRLGWHVVKNRDFHMRDSSDAERDEAERKFFSEGVWASIPRVDVGIDALRTKLGQVLLRQIRSELPSLQDDLKRAISESRAQRDRLGEPRIGKEELQFYLMGISQQYQTLTRSALEGTYRDPFFKLSELNGYATRLRAVVQNMNKEFALIMYEKGHRWEIVPDNNKGQSNSPRLPSLLDMGIEDPENISRSKYLEHVSNMVQQSRGPELPTTANPSLIGDLFREQAERWESLARLHIERVWQAVRYFLERCLCHLTDPNTFDALLFELIEPIMNKKRHDLETKLQELLTPHNSRHPITYDPNFVKEIKRLRSNRHGGNGSKNSLKHNSHRGDLEHVIEELLSDDEESPDNFAVAEILERMEAYYKTAITVFISNIVVLGIENCLIVSLPDFLSPKTILRMEDEQLEAIAAESEDVRFERIMLDEKIKDLEKGLQTIGRQASLLPSALRKNRSSPAETHYVQVPTITPSTPSLASNQTSFDQKNISGNEPSPASGPRTPARHASNTEAGDQLSSMFGGLSVNPSPSNTQSASRSASPLGGFGGSTSQYKGELAPGFELLNSARMGKSFSVPDDSDEDNLGVPTPPRSVGGKSPNDGASWQSTPFSGMRRPLGAQIR